MQEEVTWGYKNNQEELHNKLWDKRLSMSSLLSINTGLKSLQRANKQNINYYGTHTPQKMERWGYGSGGVDLPNVPG